MKPGKKLAEGQLRLGEISGFHGVQGWVKVFSDTKPRENIFSYSPWRVYSGDQVREMEVLHWRKQGKTLVARLKGLDDREQARVFLGAVIAVDQRQLPSLEGGEFYWHQLVGLRVFTSYTDSPVDLGEVTGLMETGSNDVLVVRCAEREHLIPWIPGDYVLDIDLSAKTMKVHWDPEF